MAIKKVIAVLGATGAQGGGLVRAILNDKSSEFSVRALTRDVNSPKAKALADMGAEVVTVDIDNYESIRSAFANAHGVYAVTFLLTSFYWENFIYFGMGPKKGPDGKLALTIPMGDKKLPGISAEDIGKCAYGIFKKGNAFIGKRVGIAGEHLTVKKIAETFTKVLGEEVVYNDVPFDVYRGFGFPAADDVGNMFQFYHDFEDYFTGVRSIEFSKSLNPQLKNFDSWLKENKEKIPIE